MLYSIIIGERRVSKTWWWKFTW